MILCILIMSYGKVGVIWRMYGLMRMDLIPMRYLLFIMFRLKTVYVSHLSLLEINVP